MHPFSFFLAVAACMRAATAITLDVTSTDSIKDTAKSIAGRLMTYYTGDQLGGTPGLLPQPYYRWEAGGMFGTLIDYWHFTGDSQYNKIVSDALIFQASPAFDYMPPNQTKNEGNDDQAFWGFAVMTTAETAFPNPPAGHPSWVSMAQAVWNSQAMRWDKSSCGGGLRWQIQPYNNGYNYKNSPSNAGFMNLGARLYAYTGNQTYRNFAQDSWEWMESIGLIASDYQVFDGSDDTLNCTELDHTRWSYNAGMVLHTAAVMWNKTENQVWRHRVNGVWNASQPAFLNDNMTMYESACEPFGKGPGGNCNLDQQSFKAYYSRFIAATVKNAPWLYNVAQPYLAASASAAAASCVGGPTETDCGTKWTTNGTFDGLTGVGQQMSALQVVISNLVQQAAPPVDQHNGGISTPNASLGNGGDPQPPRMASITNSEKSGAIFLTVFLLLWTAAGAWWMTSED